MKETEIALLKQIAATPGTTVETIFEIRNYEDSMGPPDQPGETGFDVEGYEKTETAANIKVKELELIYRYNIRHVPVYALKYQGEYYVFSFRHVQLGP